MSADPVALYRAERAKRRGEHDIRPRLLPPPAGRPRWYEPDPRRCERCPVRFRSVDRAQRLCSYCASREPSTNA
jgi:hypothetical protein